MLRILSLTLAGFALSASAYAARLTLDPSAMANVDAVITAAVDSKQVPGAVLVVGRGDRVVYRKAYGQRSLLPQSEAMTVDTIFDLASLTKPIATATSVMLLVERGKLRLNDRVSVWIPEFAAHGKDTITIRHLLTHVSGLRDSLDLTSAWAGAEHATALAATEVPLAAPGEKFIYSDIGFLLLGEIVARASGMPFDEFVATQIVQPLDMRDTSFKPPASQHSRIAPTEKCSREVAPCPDTNDGILLGVVHDPTARRMGGVAGHAGLFGTADDLARYCRMILAGGRSGKVQVLSPLAVVTMTSKATPNTMPSVRGLGWDIDTVYSSNRGDLFPVGSFGHTGFTGTSIWIDPATETFVILLTNRVHPDGKGDAVALRARVATGVAAALRGMPPGAVMRAPYLLYP
jgi:CubicO group peptidase (beta-lactamase class C family)